MAEFSFPKEDRVLSSADYQRVVGRGRCLQTPNFRLFFLPGTHGRRRLGLVVGRKVGKAVVRNRIKRVLREYFRLHRSRFPEGCDAVVAVRPGVGWVTLASVAEELSRAIEGTPRPRRNRP